MSISPVPIRHMAPLSNITPFTYSDGWTYLQVLTRLREYLQDILTPEFAKAIEDTYSDFQSAMDDYHAGMTLNVEQFNNLFTDYVANVEARFLALAEPMAKQAVDTYLDDPSTLDSANKRNIELADSATRNALNSVIDGLISTRLPSPDDKIMYVSQHGNNNNDGFSVGTAKATVKAALSTGATYIKVGVGRIAESVSWGEIPANTVIDGSGDGSTVIQYTGSTDLCSLGTAVSITNLTVDGSGSRDGVKGLTVKGTAGRQSLSDMSVAGFDGSCIDFELQAGSQFRATNVSANRRNAPSGSGKYAVNVPDGSVVGAVPRMFVNFQSNGSPAFNFGSCDNFYINNSTIADLRYTPNSRGVSIIGGRILNVMEVEVKGHNNSIIGGNYNPQIFVAEGSDNITIGPGSFNRLPVVDRSKNPRNNINHWKTPWDSEFTAGGNQAFLNDGELTVAYSRSATQIICDFRFKVGVSTVLGSGAMQFTIPGAGVALSSVDTGTQVIGVAHVQDGASQSFLYVQKYVMDRVRLLNLDGSLFTGNKPDGSPSLKAGAIVRFSLSYNV